MKQMNMLYKNLAEDSLVKYIHWWNLWDAIFNWWLNSSFSYGLTNSQISWINGQVNDTNTTRHHQHESTVSDAEGEGDITLFQFLLKDGPAANLALIGSRVI